MDAAQTLGWWTQWENATVPQPWCVRNAFAEWIPHSDGNRRNNEVHLNDDDNDDGEDAAKFLSNELDGKVAKNLKKSYERLHRLATNTHEREFEEPKVNGLWKLAQEADFNSEELESMKKELKHYEHRLQKMHHMKA